MRGVSFFSFLDKSLRHGHLAVADVLIFDFFLFLCSSGETEADTVMPKRPAVRRRSRTPGRRRSRHRPTTTTPPPKVNIDSPSAKHERERAEKLMDQKWLTFSFSVGIFFYFFIYLFARALAAEKKKPHIKKPLNAFMLYMKEMRAKVVAECTLKESAAINQILGRRVSSSLLLKITKQK